MPEERFSYFDLDDFSPGIMSRALRSTTGAGPYPPGSARADGTWRCLALPSGGLGPAPKRNSTLSLDPPEGASATWDSAYHIVGFMAFGPIVSGSPTTTQDEVHVAVEYSTGASRRFRWYRFLVFNGSNTQELIKSVNSATSPTTGQWFGLAFGTQRMHPTDVTAPGFPVVGCSWAAGDGSADRFISIFPDPTAPTTVSVWNISTSRFGSVVMHQNRLVLLESQSFAHATPGGIPTNEVVSFTDTNGMTLGTEKQIFMPEYPNGYGAYGSISNGELFLVKNQGGGVLVSGDIADPTIYRLQGVVSTGGMQSRAAATPIGLIYAVRDNGAWVWRGADTSQKVSHVLEDDAFTNPDGLNFLNERAFFAAWGDLIVTSNNWIMDTNTGGWWRLENPADVTLLHVSPGFPGHWLWGAKGSIASGSAQSFAYLYRRDQGALTYEWTSHPLQLDREDRIVELREVLLTAQGAGTVTVFLYDETATLIETIVFTTTQTANPHRIRKNANCRGKYITAKIFSDGGSTAAPIVHGIRFGSRPLHHIPT